MKFNSIFIRSHGSANREMVVQHFLGKEKAGGLSPPVGSQFNSTVSFHLFVDFFSRNAARK